jgi:N-acetylmuramoyl-L-alanine amidase
MDLTDEEIETLAYTLLGEAEGEGVEGMIAVANVIRNRAESGLFRTNDPAEIATQTGQFTTNDPKRGNQTATRQRNPAGSKLYETAAAIVRETFVKGTLPDLTDGAIYYHTKDVAPSWSASVKTAYGTKKIGAHVFYPREAPAPIAPQPLPRSERVASNDMLNTVFPGTPQSDALDAINEAVRVNQAGGVAELAYANFGVRDQPVNEVLEREIQVGVTSVYGSGYRVEIMSGSGPHGTERHRDLEHGYAADVWIYAPDGHRLSPEEMRPMGQHWLANKIGSVGMPQPGDDNSLHLDLIGGKGPASRPLGKGEGIQWTYPPGGKLLPAKAPEYVSTPDAVRAALTYVGIPRQRPNFERAGRSSGQMIDELRSEMVLQKAALRSENVPLPRKRPDTVPTIDVVDLPPRRPETRPEAKPTREVQTAKLPSGKTIEIGRIYTIGGRDYIGGQDGGIGTLTEAPQSIVNEATANSIVGEAVREKVRSEISKGIKSATAAAPGLAQDALSGISEIAGDVGSLFGGIFAPPAEKLSGAQRIDGIVHAYTMGGAGSVALRTKAGAKAEADVILRIINRPENRVTAPPSGGLVKQTEQISKWRDSYKSKGENYETEVKPIAGASVEAKGEATVSRVQSTATAQPVSAPKAEAAIKLSMSKVKATATVAQPVLKPEASVALTIQTPRATKTVEQIGREADNARLSGYRQIQEMGPRTPVVKPQPAPVLKPKVAVPTQQQLQAMRSVTGTATKTPVKAVATVTGNLGAAAKAEAKLKVSPITAVGDAMGTAGVKKEVGADIKVKTIKFEGGGQYGLGAGGAYASELTAKKKLAAPVPIPVPAKKLTPVKVQTVNMVKAPIVVQRKPKAAVAKPTVKYDPTTGNIVTAPQQSTEWQEDRFQWTDNTYVPSAISGSSRWQTGY